MNNTQTAGSLSCPGTPDPEAKWESFRSLITRLYLQEDMALPDVVNFMAREHDFLASERMFKGRLRKWGVKKNNTKHGKSCFKPGRRPTKSRSTKKLATRRLRDKDAGNTMSTPVKLSLEGLTDSSELPSRPP
ncbi:hypothetical protein Cob_v012174 [Colletotrichum orbiculare MAFF 240422]|uniref:Clr5 domain-containing protein n=1 Tax=Colletotrichum orbiculare (strain 104-T / ATCC 96160 / CBS 514.97 / LARS 414 / MAFF 240422) TaxID=1213857 RepID=A0A484FA72_COLOR|nr:hypothetical protein Cob_v012174 [Colletotrichum orbiculare MAFF 240422]